MAKKNRRQRQAARAVQAEASTTRPAAGADRPHRPAQAERFEARRRARRRRALRNRVIGWGLVALVAGGLVFNWANDQ